MEVEEVLLIGTRYREGGVREGVLRTRRSRAKRGNEVVQE